MRRILTIEIHKKGFFYLVYINGKRAKFGQYNRFETKMQALNAIHWACMEACEGTDAQVQHYEPRG